MYVSSSELLLKTQLPTIIILHVLITWLSLYLSGSCARTLTQSLYRCANSRCTLPSNVCNDFDNCGDMSDEMGCSAANTVIFTIISTVVLNLLAVISIL